MRLPRFRFCEPESIEEACARLAEEGGRAAVVAGGTDLLVKMKRGLLRPEVVLSIARLRGRAPVSRGADGAAVLDALATMAELVASEELPGALGCIAEGARNVGSPLIRNRATVGGNLASARPCADTAPPLLVLGARVRLRSAARERLVGLDGFFAGPGLTCMAPGELLTAIEVPAPPARSGAAFLKLTRRSTLEITIVSAAAYVAFDEGGERIREARVFLGSVAPVPLRAAGAEGALVGERPGRELLAHAAALAAADARPIDDFRGSAAYRREMVDVLVRRALEQAVSRAGGAS
jgi:carbon-monoxide dehydrogenase medium subunit